MALSAATTRKFEGQQEEISPKVEESDTYYRGAILCYNGDGYAAVPTDTAALFPAGIVTGYYEGGVAEDAYEVDSGENPRAILRRGKVWLPLGSAAQTDVGELVYISDDETLTQTAGSKTVAAPILDVDVSAGLVLVDIRQFSVQ
ncbi:MAG: hypothetical protein ACOCZB_05965 [Spirochaetota bacterium]